MVEKLRNMGKQNEVWILKILLIIYYMYIQSLQIFFFTVLQLDSDQGVEASHVCYYDRPLNMTDH